MADRLPKNSFVVIISGPSGVGKDTLVDLMIKSGELPHFHKNVSWTTRQPRPNEPADIYHFVDEAEFERAEAAGEFLQTNEAVYGNRYATSFPGPLPDDTVELFLLLPDSAQKVKAYFSNAKVYLIEPPSLPELRRRLEARGVFDFADLERREHAADSELRACREIADHRLVNETNQQAEAAQKLHDLIRTDWQSLQAASAA